MFGLASCGIHGSFIQLFRGGDVVDDPVDDGTDEGVDEVADDVDPLDGWVEMVDVGTAVVCLWASVSVWESEDPSLSFLSPTPNPTPRLTAIPIIN